MLRKVNLHEFDCFQKTLGVAENDQMLGALGRHFRTGDRRLNNILFHPSRASLQLWNFLMTEEERLAQARADGVKLVGTLKDLGTVPVIVYAFDSLRAFYPDGAWWLPCFKALTTDLFAVAEACGMGEGMCPVRAMLAAFETKRHFPIPELLISSTGAICDDFAAAAGRLHEMGYPVHFWEMPHVRSAEPYEESVVLPDGRRVPTAFVDLVEREFALIVEKCEALSHEKMTDGKLARSIADANAIRGTLNTLREKVYTAPRPKLPALEMLIAEMLIIHYCSDKDLCRKVLDDLLAEVEATPDEPGHDAKIYWVNPVADLRAMNMLEACGGMLCGTDFMFPQALMPISENKPPLRALAEVALCDVMCAPTAVRAEHVLRDVQRFGAKGVVCSRISGASHCAYEAYAIRKILTEQAIPLADIEIQSVCDSFESSMRTRIEALCEIIRGNEA